MLRPDSQSHDDSAAGRRPVILVLVGYYLPGYRGGGSTRSIANLVDALGDEFDFRIVTLNHDLGSKSRYESVSVQGWVKVGRALVRYVPSGLAGVIATIRLLRRTRADVLYVNSLFSPLFSVLPVSAALLAVSPARPIIVAPRGELSIGALRFKIVKKRTFLEVVRFFGFYQRKEIIFQSSSEAEADDIRRQLTGNVKTLTAAPFSAKADGARFPRILTAMDLATERAPTMETLKSKRKGSLRIAWLSRIVRKKNLDGALDCLRDLAGDVRFTIYGPTEDDGYWRECRHAIDRLPSNVKVTYGGELLQEDVVTELEKHDVFLFPTHGENYGHVILEALTAGCPVIVSDQTPWRGLAEIRAGWDIALENRRRFVEALQQCVDMDTQSFEEFSSSARAYGMLRSSDHEPVEQHRQLFRSALELQRTNRGVQAA
jgi:glycosyltransferase involved in cell wall biosynthesis